MSGDDDEAERWGDRAAALGWTWLALWAAAGLGLEAGHGLKLGALLDHEGVRLMLRLAHAHGVGLALVLLAFAATGPRRLGPRTAGTLGLLAAAAVLVPGGFALGAWGHGEVDPGIGVWLVPVGGLALLAGLGRTALAAVRYARRNRSR